MTLTRSSGPLTDHTDKQIRHLVAGLLRDIPDFPKPGVLFKDFTPLLADGAAMGALVEHIADRYRGRVDTVVGIEARGFILGAAVAHELGVGFVPVRKAGKLPADTHEATYTLEYGTASLEIHVDAFVEGHRVLVMDDVLATGGTAAATCDLVERAGGVVVAVEVVLEIDSLNGRSALPGRKVASILRT
ncbi:MAG: adenine phosphoribosyltransferase [Actinomycetales bacterium]|nr:MAG: adenine phosphoribosyltransferase [Actinomycetales bacterium]